MLSLYLRIHIERYLYLELCSIKHMIGKLVNGVHVISKCYILAILQDSSVISLCCINYIYLSPYMFRPYIRPSSGAFV
jgi:ABC-type siderophore export system fused ATPase/permease subunit